MTIEQIRVKLKSHEYDFLRTDKRLGNNIIILVLGGSYAYGMAGEDSDLDLRGTALNSKSDILLGTDFKQVVDVGTDTTVYSFNKMIALLASGNPNIIEELGCLPEHYLYLSDIGKELLDKRQMFLSGICIHTFGGYAGSQIRRMEKKAAGLVGRDDLGKHMAHLIRLYLMCIDILEKEEVITYRSDEHDLLMKIRNGDFLNAHGRVIPEFYDLLAEYQKRFKYASEHTSLPEKPDYKRINEFKMYINERVVKGEI